MSSIISGPKSFLHALDIGPKFDSHLHRSDDISMASMFNSSERTAGDWKTLLSNADPRFMCLVYRKMVGIRETENCRLRTSVLNPQGMRRARLMCEMARSASYDEIYAFFKCTKVDGRYYITVRWADQI